MRWNTLHGTAVIESYQSKPNKLKYVPFMAGPDRHSDWVLLFGDHLVWDHGQTRYSTTEKNPLLPDLDGPSSGTKLSNYIKGLQPAGRPGSLKRYSDVAGGTVPSLPPQPTAAGVRPGAADTLACAVPAELGVHNTGHDLTGLSALWEYLQALHPPRLHTPLSCGIHCPTQTHAHVHTCGVPFWTDREGPLVGDSGGETMFALPPAPPGQHTHTAPLATLANPAPLPSPPLTPLPSPLMY